MIAPEDFFNHLEKHGVNFYAGVPDSLLSSFCSYVDDHVEKQKHLITANEGNALALAMGYHLSTGKTAAVYMQNSGIGNIINPLTSLADIEVYKIPILLIIGWRGEPEIADEPQHIKQGRITLHQLDTLEIPYSIINPNTNILETLDTTFKTMQSRNGPVALVICKDTFTKYKSTKKSAGLSNLTREEALSELLNLCTSNDLIISTTGKTSRELYELRSKRNEAQCDFLTVGGMGHTSSIALGVAIGQPKKRVICLDGDGSLLMHMGSLPVIGNYKPNKFIHVLFNNGCHESVGGQPTVAGNLDFKKISTGCGYSNYQLAIDLISLKKSWLKLVNTDGPSFLELKIKNGARDDLGRPKNTPEENKLAFMKAANAS